MNGKFRLRCHRLSWLFLCTLVMPNPVILAAPVDIALNLGKGTVQSWDFIKTRVQTRDGQSTQSRRSVTPLTSRILERGPDGYVVQWQFGQTVFDAQDPQAPDRNAEIARLMALTRDLKYQVELTPAGEFVRLRNFEEVKTVMEPMMESMLQQAGSGANPEAQRQLRAALMGMVTHREQFEAVMLKDLRILLFPFGKVLDDAQSLHYDDEIQNPFGGAPLKVEATVALKRAMNSGKKSGRKAGKRSEGNNRQSSFATITLTQKLAPESIALVLDGLMKAVPALPQPSPEARKELTADIEDLGSYELDLTTGAIASASYSRTITAPNAKRVDTVTFIRKGNAKTP